MGREPVDAVDAAGLLVRRGGEQHVAPEAGDGVAGRIQAGGAGSAGEQPHDRRPRARPSASCRRRRGPRRSRRRRPRRTGRASSRRGGGRDDVEVGEQQQGLAAGPVAAEPDEDAAAARASGPATSGSRPSARKTDARCSATASSRPGRVRRVDRRDPDDRAEQLDELERARRPRRARQAPRTADRGERHQVIGTPRIAPRNPSTNPPITITATIHTRIRR